MENERRSIEHLWQVEPLPNPEIPRGPGTLETNDSGEVETSNYWEEKKKKRKIRHKRQERQYRARFR